VKKEVSKGSPGVSSKRKGTNIADEASSEDEPDMDEEEASDENGDDSENSDGDEPVKKGKLFSDENIKWLKPKKELLSSDEDDSIGDDDEMADDDDDDDESDDEMEVEKQSRLLDARLQEEEEEAEEELRDTVSKNTSIYHLPTKEELQKDVDRVVPPSELRSHVDSILEVLADFKQRREPGRTRSEYVDQLGAFVAELYGYLPELIEYFLTMFSPAEALEFVDYSDKPRPMVIRTNTLKTRRKDLALALIKRGVSLDPLASWSKVGLKIIESPVPVGATPEYLSGHYMLQSAASMCPVLALAPQPNERVLDMSSAPGGKTSYIAQLMRNTGVVFANDLKPDRQKATVANMHRLGVKNVVACTHDGRKMPKMFQHYKFDRVLLDAPCSGLGVISRDPSCKVQRTLADVHKTAHLQKELLLASIDLLNHKSKTGGVMVYSTCSVSVAENEEVVNYALQKRDIKIIDTGLDFGRYQHSIRGDG
jgi:ribosomal RNA methyltransferase Nop2